MCALGRRERVAVMMKLGSLRILAHHGIWLKCASSESAILRTSLMLYIFLSYCASCQYADIVVSLYKLLRELPIIYAFSDMTSVSENHSSKNGSGRPGQRVCSQYIVDVKVIDELG